MKYLIRADANTHIGAGHVMRCLALAQGWQAHRGQITFITACDSDGLRHRLLNEGLQVITLEHSYPHPHDWEITSQLIGMDADTWVVLDGYHFDSVYQQQVKKLGPWLLVIDDMAHLDHYYADIVLNQNVNAEQLSYSCEPYTHLLLGTQYALLRHEFWSWRAWRREIPKVARKILVTLGGGDAANQTLKVIQALQRIEVDGLEVRVVVGATNPHFQTLQAAADKATFPIQLIQNVIDMPELISWADTAISAGGSTCWELAFLGLPSLLLILAENQRQIAEGLDRYGAALNLGWYAEVDELDLARVLNILILDPVRRGTISEAGQRLVDGVGVSRIISRMHELAQLTSSSEPLQVRQADFQDAKLLWRWANDPSVRVNAFHPEAISLDKHIAWYKKKLNGRDTRIWILELNQVPVAQIRYDCIDSDTAEIGFSVDQSYRGKGLGTQALHLTARMAYEELGVSRLKGVVFKSNKASARAFEKAGFMCVGEEQISGQHCYVFIQEYSDATGAVL